MIPIAQPILLLQLGVDVLVHAGDVDWLGLLLQSFTEVLGELSDVTTPGNLENMKLLRHYVEH